jgi:hypothetical protein
LFLVVGCFFLACCFSLLYYTWIYFWTIKKCRESRHFVPTIHKTESPAVTRDSLTSNQAPKRADTLGSLLRVIDSMLSLNSFAACYAAGKLLRLRKSSHS